MFLNNIHRTARRLLIASVFMALLPGMPSADELSDQRAMLGIDLFPSFLAADADIAGKVCGDGMLHLLLIYAGRENLAEEMAKKLSRIKEIRGIPIRISISGIQDLDKPFDYPIAGVFLVERLGQGLEAVIRFGRDERAIVFSSFPGDVERGVPSGMVISDRILPFVNTKALRLSGIHIKSFFLRIAEQYGE